MSYGHANAILLAWRRSEHWLGVPAVALVPDDGLRQTQVTLRVTWDPAIQDHPSGWDWEILLDCDAQLISFEECDK